MFPATTTTTTDHWHDNINFTTIDLYMAQLTTTGQYNPQWTPTYYNLRLCDLTTSYDSLNLN